MMTKKRNKMNFFLANIDLKTTYNDHYLLFER